MFRRVILSLAVLLTLSLPAAASTQCNGINNCNETKNITINKTKSVVKKTEVINNVTQGDEIRTFDAGVFIDALNLIEFSDDFSAGIRYEGTGFFDGAVKDNHQILVGLSIKWSALSFKK